VVVADDFQKMGLGVAMKRWQFRLGAERGAKKMESHTGLSDEVVKVYRRAAEKDGLPIEVHRDLRWQGPRSPQRVTVDLRPLRPSDGEQAS
jgi:hypothetical protein